MKIRDIKKTILLILLNSSVMFSFSQELTFDFCERFKADQSYLKIDSLSKEENDIRNSKRKKEFYKNYKILKTHLDTSKTTSNQLDSCYLKFIQVTLIHNAQIFPEMFYSYENIDFIAKKVTAKQIKKQNLAMAIFFYASYNKPERLCIKYKPLVFKAISEWGLKEEQFIKDLGEIKFTENCH